MVNSRAEAETINVLMVHKVVRYVLTFSKSLYNFTA